MLARRFFHLCLVFSAFFPLLKAQEQINDSSFQDWEVLNHVVQRGSKRKLQRKDRSRNSAEERQLTIDDFLMFRQLRSASGFYLQILPSGIVKGTRADHDIYGILQVVHESDDVVTFRGVKTGLYLAMNRRGELYGQRKKSKESYFEMEHIKEWLYAFKSKRYPRKTRRRQRRKSWYISFQKNGITKSGSRAKLRQGGTRFLLRPVEPQRVPELYPFPVEVLSDA
ncbi:fibroblast growth factor 20-like [Ptychodera flava]|uniref:fibroblast growth factor 20-like n=1 Tax=Ptychodera flava TaxID=63121 RepID=UPI003969BC07